MSSDDYMLLNWDKQSSRWIVGHGFDSDDIAPDVSATSHAPGFTRFGDALKYAYDQSTEYGIRFTRAARRHYSTLVERGEQAQRGNS